MVPAAIEEMGLVVEIGVVEAEHDAREGSEGDLDRAARDLAQQLVGGARGDAERHLRCRLDEAADDGVDPGARIGDDVVDEADAQRAPQFRPQRPDARLEALDRRHQATRLGIGELAVGRQAETGAAALAQHRAEPRFERQHVVRDRRQRQIERLLRRGKTAVIDHRDEDAQQAKVHRIEAEGALHFCNPQSERGQIMI